MANKEASLLIRIKEAGADVLDRVSSGLKTIGKVGAAAFTAVSAVVVKAIAEYAETEKAVNSLNQALVQQGIYSKDLSKAYREMADAQSEKSLYDDGEIIRAQAIMQGYLGQKKISEDLLKATLDLAAAKGMDLASAAEMVSKSIGTSTNALARQGIKLKEGTDATQKYSEVVEQLNRKFGGQAEAATRGMGSIQMMEKSINDLFKAVGEMLQPAVLLVTTSIRDMTKEIQNNSQAMDALRDIIKFTAQAGYGMYTVFASVAQLIGGTLGTAFGAISQAVSGNWAEAWETVKSGAVGVTEDLKKRFEDAGNYMIQMDNAFSETKKQNLLSEEEALRQSMANRTAIEQEKRDADIENRITHGDILKEMDQADLEHQIALEKLRNDAEFMAQLKSIENQKKYFMSKKQLAELDLEQQKLIQNKILEWDKMTAIKRLEVMQTIGNEAMQLADNLVKLTGGKNKELIALQKAMAIGMAIINTQAAITRGYMELGPIAGAIFQGVAYANLGASIAVISGVQLAEGGVVKSRPGGIQATIGEGGRDEAVIPLEDGMVPGMGGNITLIVNGGILGDEASARDFARALDRELLRLRQSNESLAFDGGVT